MHHESHRSATELAAEAAWEMEGVERARRRYQDAVRKAADRDAAHTLPPARRLILDLYPALLAAIEADKAKMEGILVGAIEADEADRKTVPGWWWAIRLIDSDKLTAIVLSLAMRAHIDDSAKVTTTSLKIAAACRSQLELDRWTEAQETANQLAKQRRDEGHVDLLAAMRRRYPDIDRKSWSRWAKQVRAIRCEPWDKPTMVAFGSYLLRLLCDACPQHIQLVTRRTGVGASVENVLALTSTTQELLKDREARAEVARPLLYPMLMPPIPWRYEDRAA